MVSGLGAELVEVDQVADRVNHGEEEGGEGADLVELDGGVERGVLVERDLLQLGDQVPAQQGALVLGWMLHLQTVRRRRQ